MGSQASRFMAQTSFAHPLRSGKAPSFLYLKNGIFYYRYRFPRWLIAHMRHTEIRVSLRTGRRPQALRLARDLHSRLQRALEMEDLPTHEELQRLLQHALDEVLNEPNKSLVAPDEIRRRLNGYLRFLLDADAQSDEGRPIAHELDQNGSVIASIGLDTAMLESAIEQQRQLNSFDGVEDWLPLSILEMIAEQVFDRREIGHDNVMALAKSYMAMQVTFKRIQAARVSGDYGPEQLFYSAESTPYPRSTTVPAPVSTPIEKHPQHSLLLSELMERYSSTRHLMARGKSILSKTTSAACKISLIYWATRTLHLSLAKRCAWFATPYANCLLRERKVQRTETKALLSFLQCPTL